MKKIIIGLAIMLSGLWVLNWLQGYFAIGQKNESSFLLDTSALQPEQELANWYSTEVLAEGLQVPWAMVFTQPNRILVTERRGTIREVIDGKVTPTELLRLPVAAEAEAGLMGLVKDPEYDTNRRLYVCYTYQNGGSLANRVIALQDKSTELTVEQTLLENAPAARFHAGCELAVGPDQKLYVTFGDATEKSLAQDRESLAGKILRLNLDGSVPSDNPFSGSAIWSYGHRNPQGIAWHPETNEMYETEHGPSGNDGPLGGDEINHIEQGQNYGWPTVSHDNSEAGMIDPLKTYTPAVAPASAIFYSGTVYPELNNNLLFATLKGTALYRAIIDSDDSNTITSYEKMPLENMGRLREIIQGPDGYIYFTSSNTDGRGTPQAGDDKIYRLLPN